MLVPTKFDDESNIQYSYGRLNKPKTLHFPQISSTNSRRRRRYGLVAVLDDWRHFFRSDRVGGQRPAIRRSRRLLVQDCDLLHLLALLSQNQWEPLYWRIRYTEIFGPKIASGPGQNIQLDQRYHCHVGQHYPLVFGVDLFRVFAFRCQENCGGGGWDGLSILVLRQRDYHRRVGRWRLLAHVLGLLWNPFHFDGFAVRWTMNVAAADCSLLVQNNILDGI